MANKQLDDIQRGNAAIFKHTLNNKHSFGIGILLTQHRRLHSPYIQYLVHLHTKQNDFEFGFVLVTSLYTYTNVDSVNIYSINYLAKNDSSPLYSPDIMPKSVAKLYIIVNCCINSHILYYRIHFQISFAILESVNVLIFITTHSNIDTSRNVHDTYSENRGVG